MLSARRSGRQRRARLRQEQRAGRAAQPAGADLRDRRRRGAGSSPRCSTACAAIPAVTEIGVHQPHARTAAQQPSRRFWPEGQDLREDEVRRADYRRVSTASTSRRCGFRCIARPRCSTTPIAPTSPPVAIVSAGARARRTGRARIRSAADSSSPPTARGSRWSACRATSCTTGSSGAGSRPCIGPSRRSRRLASVFAMRTVGDPMALAGDLRRAVAAADPDQPIAALTSLDALVEDARRRASTSSPARSAWSR